MIPAFDPGGNLPSGIHATTWALFVAQFGRTDHRRRLISGLKRALDSLKEAACQHAYIDGSFVTDKERPGTTTRAGARSGLTRRCSTQSC